MEPCHSFRPVPVTCWGVMEPVFLMKVSSLSNEMIGSLVMSGSDLSRAPLVVLPWFARWRRSSLAGRPFSCLTGWTPLTTWADRLVGREMQSMVLLRMTQATWVIPASSNYSRLLRSTPKKHFQIQRVNISWNQPFCLCYNSLCSWTVRLLVFPMEVYNNANLQQTWLLILSWHTGCSDGGCFNSTGSK